MKSMSTHENYFTKQKRQARTGASWLTQGKSHPAAVPNSAIRNPQSAFIVLYKGEYPIRFIARGYHKVPTYEITTEPEATRFTDELEAARIAARHEIDQYKIIPVQPPIHLRPVTANPNHN
jgi:hypothetical protein